jgi:elongator complex protein 4
MSFRKRNIALLTTNSSTLPAQKQASNQIPGVKPSPLIGVPTTSTGTASLDKLLALGAGLALGSSLLVEEEGTTDFASALLRCFAAEGVLQGHAVFCMSPEGAMVLPGVVEEKEQGKKSDAADGEKMKIAWRYESLRGHGVEEKRGAFYCLTSFMSYFCIYTQNQYVLYKPFINFHIDANSHSDCHTDDIL